MFTKHAVYMHRSIVMNVLSLVCVRTVIVIVQKSVSVTNTEGS